MIPMATHSVELDDEDVQTIFALCDIGLKTYGLSFLSGALRILNKMPKQEPKQTPEAQEPLEKGEMGDDDR